MSSAYSKKRDKMLEVQTQQSNKIKENFSKNVTINFKKVDLTKIVNVDINALYSAPSEWNKYEPLSDDDLYEVAESISENGLMSPIILWKINKKEIPELSGKRDMYNYIGEEYMILSGHNRVKIYHLFNKKSELGDKYSKIPAFIFDELSEFQAKNIIIDNNYLNRDLTTKQKVESIMYKYDIYQKEKVRKGAIAEFIADDLGVTPRMVYNYKKLSELNPSIKEKVYVGEIALTSALKLSAKSMDFQDWLCQNYLDKIDNKLLNKIKDTTKKSDIERWISTEPKKEKLVKLTMEIPPHLKEEVKNLVYQFVYNKTKRD